MLQFVEISLGQITAAAQVAVICLVIFAPVGYGCFKLMAYSADELEHRLRAARYWRIVVEYGPIVALIASGVLLWCAAMLAVLGLPPVIFCAMAALQNAASTAPAGAACRSMLQVDLPIEVLRWCLSLFGLDVGRYDVPDATLQAFVSVLGAQGLVAA